MRKHIENHRTVYEYDLAWALILIDVFWAMNSRDFQERLKSVSQ